MNIKEYAIKAFNEGSDNFGETVTGEVGPLRYNTMQLFGGKDPHYVITVHLRETPTHTSTSGIGFYVVNCNGIAKLRPCSGHMLNWTIEITDEIDAELKLAEYVDC